MTDIEKADMRSFIMKKLNTLIDKSNQGLQKVIRLAAFEY